MGPVCPCVRNQQVDKTGKEGEFSLAKAKIVEKTIKAAQIIQRVFREYHKIAITVDHAFENQAKKLKLHNEIVVKKIKEFPPFRFNRVLSNIPRELREITTLDNNIQYSGYWYSFYLGIL